MTARRHVTVILLLVPLLYPIAWLFFASFKPPAEIVQSLALLPREYILDNYRSLTGEIAGVHAWRFFVNSTVVAGACAIANIASCSLAAYAFARLEFRFKRFWFAVMLGTMMLPIHVIIVPQYIMFARADLINTFWPLIIPKLLATDGFFVFLMVQFIRGLPRELDDAARIDGCSHFGIFFRIILPLSMPALATTAIFTFIWTWNDFFSQLIYLTDPDRYTVPVALRTFVDATSQTPWGPVFAMSIVSLAPIFGFFLAGQRYLVRGIATTGLK
jgi:multiple sugar transport system permease protein